ncbi:glutamine amidotransferase [Jeongeupia naejangsanensis]|uniref:Glutamine amidotransferase n=1 Tax=Jeongeupia naejangsanensis TaxID=613195 RepID=A0ABS2BIW3_9NEIS|nr:glutamine amidotransferase [Jeongeupia naejangsanensis]MBM3115548.1 glutamine amidotransferase [Jeongeupia naejangsanensis]
MSRTAWIIRHLAFEDLGTLGESVSARGYTLRYLEAGVDAFDVLADAGVDDLLVVLGGPIGVYQTDRYPWLLTETVAIAGWLDSGRAALGICLGAQLIAAALGARVYPGHGKEIGWSPLTLNDAGKASPLRHLDGALTSMLHWHGDTFDLPANAELLASTGMYPHQAYRVGARVLAFQCHPEIDAGRFEQWLIGHCDELDAAGIGFGVLRAQTAAEGTRLRAQAALCVGEWLDSL